jgi:hypothetical protein
MTSKSNKGIYEPTEEELGMEQRAQAEAEAMAEQQGQGQYEAQQEADRAEYEAYNNQQGPDN